MATIVKRGGLGRSLTISEMDANFENLNTDKLEAGADVTFGDITGDLKGYREVLVTTAGTGSVNLDLASANIFRLNLTGDTTVTFTNPPAAGSTSVATIVAIQDGSGGHTITWTDGAFAGGVAPPASTGANDVVVSLSMKDVS
jgi:hypothetical protein